jgi:CheY-like chemotaxis protein
LQGLVVIAVSASVSKEDQARSREVGFDDFLPKPIHWPSLAALLAKHLGLEWEYEAQKRRRAEAQGKKLFSAPLVPPPQKELVVLLDLARRGNMRAVREQAAYIETLDEQYVPFAKKLQELAKGFEERDLLALIERHMEEDE